MIQASITYSASVSVDNELRQISGSEAVDAVNIVTGKQNIGTAYEVIAATTVPMVGLVLYNPSDVDVSVRLTLLNFSVNEFVFMNLIAGGMVVVPQLMQNDAGNITYVGEIAARTATGTADIDYCLLY